MSPRSPRIVDAPALQSNFACHKTELIRSTRPSHSRGPLCSAIIKVDDYYLFNMSYVYEILLFIAEGANEYWEYSE